MLTREKYSDIRKKIGINDVSNMLCELIKAKRVDYGQDVIFPSEIDTAPCEDFFVKRCPHNVHVTCSRTAHKDRFDPRFDWKKHLDFDLVCLIS